MAHGKVALTPKQARSLLGGTKTKPKAHVVVQVFVSGRPTQGWDSGNLDEEQATAMGLHLGEVMGVAVRALTRPGTVTERVSERQKGGKA